MKLAMEKKNIDCFGPGARMSFGYYHGNLELINLATMIPLSVYGTRTAINYAELSRKRDRPSSSSSEGYLSYLLPS